MTVFSVREIIKVITNVVVLPVFFYGLVNYRVLRSMNCKRIVELLCVYTCVVMISFPRSTTLCATCDSCVCV